MRREKAHFPEKELSRAGRYLGTRGAIGAKPGGEV